MNVVILGAAGFLGSHLAQAYAARGDDVLAIDNLSSGARQNLLWDPPCARVTFVEADICASDGRIETAIEALGGADIILHFASFASPAHYMQHPIETLRANSVGTERCCALAVRHKARLLYASTSEVYGDPLEHPQTETYWGNVNPVGPRACYDEGKRFGEAMVTAYANTRGLDARIVRIFNTYGPRMRRDDGRVVPEFLSAVSERRPFMLYGDGLQTRSFCYVDDLVDGVMRTVASERLGAMPVNLGNPHEVTIRAFATIVAEVAGVELRLAWADRPVDDPVRRRPDISRARELLGWSPRIDLHEGLRRTLAAWADSSGRAS
jgi:nucleoside-diphosphate-sugar epimerase